MDFVLSSIKCGLYFSIVLIISLSFLVLESQSSFSRESASPAAENFSDNQESDDVTGQCCESAALLYNKRNLLLLSTLDGHLTALDTSSNGDVLWSIQTDTLPLFSSTIGNLLFKSDDSSFRLIPSLDGSFYMYDDTVAKAVPVNADMLLSGAMKPGTDVITGGKEIRIFGIDLDSGSIQYSYDLNSRANNDSSKNEGSKANLVVRRTNRIVRAIEAMTGIERWNVTVGEHELMLPVPTDLDGIHSGQCFCYKSDLIAEDGDQLPVGYLPTADLEFRMIPAEGLIAAYHKSDSLYPVWTKKLDVPVSQVWHANGGKLKEISLFDPNVVPYVSLNEVPQSKSSQMVIYLGTFKNQMYVMRSPEERQYQSKNDMKNLEARKTPSNRLYLAANAFDLDNKRPYIVDASDSEPSEQCFDGCPTCSSDEVNSLILKDRLSKNTGSYLIKYNDDRHTQKWLTHEKSDQNDAAQSFAEKRKSKREKMKYIFWTWWNIFLFVGVPVTTTSVVICYLLHRMQIDTLNLDLKSTESARQQTLCDVVSQVSESDFNLDCKENASYESWYLTHFEPVRCLGKGGFGVVIESLNKFDQQVYAVKRITISNKPDGKERVQREVMALAKLDHPGVVRYYNSWLEEPPSEWQEKWDKEFTENFTTSSDGILSESDRSCRTTLSGRFGLRPILRHCNSSLERLVNFKAGLRFASTNETSISSRILGQKRQNFAQNCKISFRNSAKCDDSVDIVFGDKGDPSNLCLKSNPNAVDKCLQTSDSSGSKDFQPTPQQRAYLFIQMQLCKDYTLRDWLQKRTKENYSRELALDWFDQIVFAVQYVHNCGLIHRDLKPSNIFFAQNGQLKIGDFGLAKGFISESPTDDINISSVMVRSASHTDNVGTWLYMSPEQENGGLYTFKVDIYALGLIFVEMLCIFSTEMERRTVLSNLKRKNSIFPTAFSKEFPEEMSIIQNLIVHDPDQRWSCDDIRQCKLFSQFWPSRPLMLQKSAV